VTVDAPPQLVGRAVALAALVAAAGAAVAATRDVPRHNATPRTPPTHLVPTDCAPRRLTRAVATQAHQARLVAPTRTVALHTPFRVTPALGGAHVFPVARGTLVVDTFGAPRSDTGWHHGDDLFAPSGTPVVAVADGFVFSVGWQRLGGRRLWLRDTDGNEFYYAHLSAYAHRLRSGEDVRAGDIVGYVGSSGDAEQTPPHLHFEIHPASLLGLGYDGAVDPTRYLDGWPRVSGRAIAPVVRVERSAPGCSARTVALAASH
jgi:murein DD-endopeptidase MepM/ murein hydrolase activator NlpD